MANGPGLSTATGGEIYVGSEVRDAVTLLDILYANQFEGQKFAPETINQTEDRFYRGAPPVWLNFHISEQAASGGAGVVLIKRDGYDELVDHIQQRRKYPGILAVKLFHQPGCGGTTLAMQVLWDLRKTFRCAVLTGSTSDLSNVAKGVVQLFTAGSRNYQNTVLLLLSDEQILDHLQESIMDEIEAQKLAPYMCVVIVLCCLRKDAVLQSGCVVLDKSLSDVEKQQFSEKKSELSMRYGDQHKLFHGFNILQTNFSQDYVRQACTVFSSQQKGKRKAKAQLAVFLALLNAYVPGSYLLESQCLDFLKQKDSTDGDVSLKNRMEPFSHLIVTFTQNTYSERRVRLAHPMIAQSCVQLMAEAGVKRSDIARSFLTYFCRDAEVPQHLLNLIKDMLTRREEKRKEKIFNDVEMKEEKEKFSRLILDIKEMEDKVQSASLLKVASNQFDTNPFFPQTLARFLYIELQLYSLAEFWAKIAKQRDPHNSFIADTLGQVHKNHLKSRDGPVKPREILHLAKKAIEAFKDEELLAEKEYEAKREKHGNSKFSCVHNTRGQFGYLQVCNSLYDLLVSQEETWGQVLTNKMSMFSVSDFFGDNKLNKFNNMIKSFRDEVERKYKFFDKVLTYSKPNMRKNDAPYMSREISDCCRKYVGDVKDKCDVIQKLKANLADTSTGVLSCLDRGSTKSELKEITTWWEELCSSPDSLRALVNYIFAHIMLTNTGERFCPVLSLKNLNSFKQKIPLSPTEAPELHMLALILYWPTSSADKCIFDLNQAIQRMRNSYERSYQRHFVSRYLQPLFFIGKGQGPERVIHRKVLERLIHELNKEKKQDSNIDWSDEKIFQDPTIQDKLLKMEGVVRNYRVYTAVGETEIEVNANMRNNLWKPRQVTFNLGFTIRGPVAFGIRTRTAEKGEHFIDRHQTTLINRVSDTGHILDKLVERELISRQTSAAVRALKSTQDQMRDILNFVSSAGTEGKNALYEILTGMRRMTLLISELEESK